MPFRKTKQDQESLNEKEIDFKKRFADALKSFVYKSSQNAGIVSSESEYWMIHYKNEYNQNSNGSNHNKPRCLNILLILWKTLQRCSALSFFLVEADRTFLDVLK